MQTEGHWVEAPFVIIIVRPTMQPQALPSVVPSAPSTSIAFTAIAFIAIAGKIAGVIVATRHTMQAFEEDSLHTAL